VTKNTETLLDASKENDLEVNAENTKHVHVSSPECNYNHGIKRAKTYFENMAKFRHLGKTVTNQIYLHE